MKQCTKQMIQAGLLSAAISMSTFGCAGFRNRDLDWMIIDSYYVSSDKMYERYTVSPLDDTKYFICYDMSKPEEEKAVKHILQKLAEKTNYDFNEVCRLAAISSNSQLDSKMDFPWMRCITLYGAVETMRLNFLPPEDVEEIKKSFNPSIFDKILKVIEVE